MAKTKDHADKVLDLMSNFQAEAGEMGAKMRELAKSKNPEVAEAIKFAMQYTNSIVWPWLIWEGQEEWRKSPKEAKSVIECSIEVLGEIREAQIDFATTETKALLTKWGFYKH